MADSATQRLSLLPLGRDYHKVLRARLQKLADRINGVVPHIHRVFVDSAPVMEVALAEKAVSTAGAVVGREGARVCARAGRCRRESFALRDPFSVTSRLTVSPW